MKSETPTADHATAESLHDAVNRYERRFGECPVGIMDGGGPDNLFAMIKAALRDDKPIKDPYKELPEGTLIM
jgi:hypothetical protein